MLAAIFNDVMGIFKSTFLGGDLIGLAIAVGSVLVAALTMQRSTQVGSMTLLALALFAFGGIARRFFFGADPQTAEAAGNRAVNQLEASWTQFAGMQAGTLLAYFIAFMLLILAVYGVKATVGRGH